MLNRIKTAIISFEMFIAILVVIALMAIFRDKTVIFRRAWMRLQRRIIGYKIEVIGAPDPAAQMLIINHQSMLDIMLLEELYPSDLCWVAKKEIAQLPLIGQILKLPKMIAVDRQNARVLAALIKEIKGRIDDGRVVAIFPEGTRGRGDKLLKFHSGAKMIAEKLELKVQPVALIGTRKIIDSSEFSINSGFVKLVYLPLCDLNDERWFEKAKEDIQQELLKARFR